VYLKHSEKKSFPLSKNGILYKLFSVLILSARLISCTGSFIVMLAESPYTLIVILLFQALAVALYTRRLKINLWFSYVLFIVFLGGLLIVFRYLVSLVPTLPPSSKIKTLRGFILVILLGLIRVVSLFLDTANSGERIESWGREPYSIDGLYNSNRVWIYIFSVVYLLAALFCISYMVNRRKGPLRLES